MRPIGLFFLYIVTIVLMGTAGCGASSGDESEALTGMEARYPAAMPDEEHPRSLSEMVDHMNAMSGTMSEMMDSMHGRRMSDMPMSGMMGHMQDTARCMERMLGSMDSMTEDAPNRGESYREHLVEMRSHMSSMMTDFEAMLDSMEKMQRETPDS
jgi:hypothetical protein